MEKRDYEFRILGGQRVRLQEVRHNKKGDRDGLEPSYGYYKDALTPWGQMERCYIVHVPSLAGGYEKFASVYKPKTNPGVRWSVFQVFG